VIGLGTGSMAAHASAGDVIRFYDIDPKVVDVARRHFTYLDTNKAGKENTHVILGDARISMERELKEGGSQNYDVIVLDAFSGDAIPAHLLTDQSFALYEQHLHRDETNQPDGVLAIHISNRYLELEPVVAAIAKKYGYLTWNVRKEEEGISSIETSSDWILVTKSGKFIANPTVQAAGEPVKTDKLLLWTDQQTALWSILK
jgi:spermidine synthase